MAAAKPATKAFVTFLAGDGDSWMGVVGLAKGLRKAGSAYPLVVAVLPDVPESHRRILVSQGCIVREIDPVYPPERENQTPFAMAYYVINYSKLRIWEFVEYERMVYLDADTQVFDNIDELFDLPKGHFYAVMDCQQYPDKVTWPAAEMGPPPALYFNAGKFVHEPSMATAKALLGTLRVSPTTPFASASEHSEGPIRDRGSQGSLLMKEMRNESRCNSEVNLLGSLQHKNIIRIKSHNRREDYMELIYELPGVANGNLYQWLHCSSTERTPRMLSWPMRRAIIMDVARGLLYMHHRPNKKPIIHHNLSSTNILLDMSFSATISSFDLAETSIAGLDQPLPISGPRISGNYGYVAPEYGIAIGRLTQKVDVYSFGVLMLEIVSGRVAYQNDGNCPLLLATWAKTYLKQLSGAKNTAFCNTEAVDPEIPDRSRYNKEMAAVFELGLKCTVQDPTGRPSIKKVIKQLQKRGRAWTWRSLFLWSD